MVETTVKTSWCDAGRDRVLHIVSAPIVFSILANAVLISGCSQSATEAPTGDVAPQDVTLSDNSETPSSPPGSVSAISPSTEDIGGAIPPSTAAGGDGGEQSSGQVTGIDGAPRSRDSIFREQLSLPRLYLTHPSHHRITASTGRGLFVDPKSGELAWPALACHRPDCPGRDQRGKPYLFISPDSTLYIAADGTIGSDISRSTNPNHDGQCPMCKTRRNAGVETPQQRQQYIDWVRPYVLPEAAERMIELERQAQTQDPGPAPKGCGELVTCRQERGSKHTRLRRRCHGPATNKCPESLRRG